MKTTIETTSRLVFTTQKTVGDKTIYITISLADDCKNGHEDFSITGDIYQAGKPKTDRYFISGGCIHQEIAKYFPKYKLFIALHLSDFRGTPMYAIENGFYHLKNSSKEIVMDHLRITETEFSEISKAEDEGYLKYLLFKLGVLDRWESEADQAIKLLEELTGNKFESEGTARTVSVTPKEMQSFETKIKSGYYTPEKIQERADQKTQELMEKEIAEVKAEAQKEIEDIEKERDIKLYILSKKISIDNVIYYKHSKECVFNWTDYGNMTTAEEFKNFMSNPDLPKNVKFKFLKGGKK